MSGNVAWIVMELYFNHIYESFSCSFVRNKVYKTIISWHKVFMFPHLFWESKVIIIFSHFCLLIYFHGSVGVNSLRNIENYSFRTSIMVSWQKWHVYTACYIKTPKSYRVHMCLIVTKYNSHDEWKLTFFESVFVEEVVMI